MPARSLPCQSRSHIAPRGIAGFLWGLHWLPVQYLQACWAREIRAEASTNLLEQPLLQLLLRMIPDQALVSQNASAGFTVLTHVRTLARVTPAATPVPLPSSPGAAPSPSPQCNRPSAHTQGVTARVPLRSPVVGAFDTLACTRYEYYQYLPIRADMPRAVPARPWGLLLLVVLYRQESRFSATALPFRVCSLPRKGNSLSGYSLQCRAWTEAGRLRPA